MATTVYRLLLPLIFPDGVSPGEGREGNHSILAKDGAGRPVLRGTALAGALRHGWMRLLGMDRECADEWFGKALEGEMGGLESPLRVPDCVLDAGPEDQPLVRIHIAVDRHRGAVLNGGLFSLDALPPGTSTTVCLWLHETADMTVDSREFLQELLAVISSGLTLGGNAARGMGRVALNGPARLKRFELSDLNQHADYLDERHALGMGQIPETGEELEPDPADIAGDKRLQVDVCLGIPRGEDVLIADGQGIDYEMEPQRVRTAEGNDHWRIPGSSLRGVLRGWFTRLAARAGEPVADSLENWRERDGEINGDILAHGYAADEQRRHIRELLEMRGCPIMRLFGSAYSKSRIHVSDAMSIEPIQKKQQEQVRTHVAVDRITGGAQEGALFTNTVLIGKPEFRFVITIQAPSEQEAEWLYSSLRAIDLGIIRIGSSKASGRLKLMGNPIARGMLREVFDKLVSSEVSK